MRSLLLHPRARLASISGSCTGRLNATRASSSSTRSGDTSDAPVHIPVLLHETVALWRGGAATTHGKQRYFVDGTAGFGGHSRALLERCADARLLCIDRDAEVLAIAKANLRAFGSRVAFQHGSYADIGTHLAAAGFPRDGVDGIVVDLGANSFHFDQAHRGFSWMHDGPLDMRFDQRSSAPTAADVLNTHSEVQLTRIFRDFGEERLAKEYAKAVVREREEHARVFRTTQDLKQCIERIARRWERDSSKSSKTHPATRCFQALRIYVNEELQHVESGVQALVDHLAPGGRLVTIAFHSLEDRPIKTLFRQLDKQSRLADDDDEVSDFFDDDDDDSDNEDEHDAASKRFRLVKRKAVKPTADEVAMNPRSRSARLRCLERTQ